MKITGSAFRRVLVVALGAVMCLAGCADDLDDSPAVMDSPEPAASTETRSPPTTSSVTTVKEQPVPTSTTSTTEVAESTTTLPGQVSTPAQTPAGINRAGGYAVALEESGQILLVDLMTGAVERSQATINREARWIGRFQLDWAGTAIYYAEFVEDSWFSCENSPGSIVHVDLASGEQTQLALGAEPQISPDGTHLAYLAASQCLPDPSQPVDFVLTPYDSVVVRDLATGEERRWVDVELQADLATTEGDVGEGQLGGLAWLGIDELGIGTQRLMVSTMQPLDSGVSLKGEVGGQEMVLGFYESTGLIFIERLIHLDDGERRAQLLGLDPVTGETTVFATTGSSNYVFAFDGQNGNLAVLDDGVLAVDGREVVIEAEVDNLDW